MDSDLIHQPVPELPKNNNNRVKVLIVAGAVVLIGLGLYLVIYYLVPLKGGGRSRGGEVLIPTSELTLAGTILEKKSDGLNIVSLDPLAPGQKPELYVVKILPETSFLKIDKTQSDSPEEKITFDDLKISQEVFVRYAKDESGNLNAKKIYTVIGLPVSVADAEKSEKPKE